MRKAGGSRPRQSSEDSIRIEKRDESAFETKGQCRAEAGSLKPCGVPYDPTIIHLSNDSAIGRHSLSAKLDAEKDDS